jgi:hypothetical protein
VTRNNNNNNNEDVTVLWNQGIQTDRGEQTVKITIIKEQLYSNETIRRYITEGANLW